MKNLIVFGAGLVGGTIVKDLASEPDFHVTVVDIDSKAIEKIASGPNVEGIRANLNEMPDLSELLSDKDLVVCAVPGFMGFDTVRKVIDVGKDIVDISFFPEDSLELHEKALSKNVTAVVDCGVAPGLCNIILGNKYSLLDNTDRYLCYVGGLPKKRVWPFEYKAVFSPADVLEEYTRPARFVEHGKEVTVPALTDLENIDFPETGTLEAFNTDGLRTLIRTLDIPFMKEKTLRYPGHASLMRIFRDTGFFDTETVEIGGANIRPLDLTSKLFFDKWRLGEGEEDFTIMRVLVEGEKDGKRVRFTSDLFDEYDRETNTISMARTTGFTCSIMARQVLNGTYGKKGISPPEFIGQTEVCYENLLEEYQKRNIVIRETMEELPAE